jgi:hypothetical protein
MTALVARWWAWLAMHPTVCLVAVLIIVFGEVALAIAERWGTDR